jgi:hypothetical protein
MTVLAWAMTNRSSSSAARYSMVSVATPSTTFRYGVSMKPNRLMRAYEER